MIFPSVKMLQGIWVLHLGCWQCKDWKDANITGCICSQY